jgi:hypothetical protein
VATRKVKVKHPNFRTYEIDADLVKSEPVKFVRKVPSESLEASRLVDWLRMKGLKFSHVPNESSSKKQGVKNKRAGTSKGVPDYLVLLPGSGVLWLELKRVKGGRVSPEQKEWVEALNKLPGQFAYVAYGFEDAKRLVEKHLV